MRRFSGMIGLSLGDFRGPPPISAKSLDVLLLLYAKGFFSTSFPIQWKLRSLSCSHCKYACPLRPFGPASYSSCTIGSCSCRLCCFPSRSSQFLNLEIFSSSRRHSEFSCYLLPADYYVLACKQRKAAACKGLSMNIFRYISSN